MAYNILNADGTPFATINDGTINQQSSLTLVGKNWAGYGAYLDTNFLWLLQNFSSGTQPANVVTGQLWWNKSANVLSIWNGVTWKGFSSSTSANIAPSANVTGDLWFNTAGQTLNVYNGTAWLAVGPSTINGTGAVSTKIVDTLSVSHNVIELIDNNNVVGIISQDTFTPQTSIPGFTGVYPGITVSGNIGGAGNAAGYWGASVSVTGNVTANNFIGNGALLTNINGANITGGYGNANVAAYLPTNTANVAAGNISSAGNVTGGVFYGDGSHLTGITGGSNIYNTAVAGT